MSTAKFDTLQNAAGTKSVPVATVVDGSAKAWVNFNGTGTVAIRASFNVTSITDSGVGSYFVNFDTLMPDTSYAVSSMTSGDASAPSIVYEENSGANRSSAATNRILIQVTTNGGTPVDRASVNISVFR